MQFTSPLQATVLDAYSNPVSGVTVTFTPPGTGASGSFAGGANTAVTDSSGIATSAAFTANTFAGNYSVTATAPGLASPASFSLTNTAGAAGAITPTGGTPQSATVNTAFAAGLQAPVQDGNGNPVRGASVTFTAPGSGPGGTFAGGAVTFTATTDSSGIATTPVFSANTIAGAYAVTATTGSLSASFSLTNLAGAA